MSEIKAEWKPNKVLVIGAGGIGSYAAEHIHNLVMSDQIPLSIEFNIIDFDIVEIKNVRYQNFTEEEVLEKKAEVIGNRYNLNGIMGKVESEKDLKDYDAFIVAVDNSGVRKLVYDYCYKNDKFFIDMRAEGRQIAVITQDLKKKEAMKTLPKETSMKGGSCQLKYEFEQGIIQYGNVIVSAIGLQMFLNKIRGDSYNAKIIMRC